MKAETVVLMTLSDIGNKDLLNTTISAEAVAWYFNLDIDTKINLKECFKILCGIPWECSFLFNILERATLAYNKLKLEKMI